MKTPAWVLFDIWMIGTALSGAVFLTRWIATGRGLGSGLAIGVLLIGLLEWLHRRGRENEEGGTR